ncbi:MAG: hypothetical protein ACODAQ_08455 [Phycisphaeraceae bacterium]
MRLWPALLHVLLAAPVAWGQAGEPASGRLALLPLPAELDPTERTERAALEPAERRDPFNLYVGVDFVSMYVSRGQVFSSKFSVQPWFEMDVPLAGGEPVGGWGTLSAFAGNWNSFQEGDPGLGQSRSGGGLMDNWFEADIYGGFRATFLDHFGSSLRFNYYTSPSDSFSDINELDWRLSYDDTHWWADGDNDANFQLNPSLRIAKEVNDRGGPDGWYFQPALRPSFDLTALPGDLRMEIPLILGFGADGQYRGAGGEEIHFGFFQTGVGIGGPLEVLGENEGSLRWSVAVDVIYVSDRAINFRGDRINTVGKMGISYSY